MANILYIDTSSNKKILIKLETQEGIKEVSSQSKVLKSQAALPLIAKLLKENNLDINQVNEIKVAYGSGSFTGLRVGASIANALGFLLNIPINGKKIGEFVEPVYNK